LNQMLREAPEVRRVLCALKQLMLGIKCGLTDTTSGLSASLATGMVADMIIESGSTVIKGSMK